MVNLYDVYLIDGQKYEVTTIYLDDNQVTLHPIEKIDEEEPVDPIEKIDEEELRKHERVVNGADQL